MVTGVQYWDKTARGYDEGIDHIFGNNLRQIILGRLQKEEPLGRTVEFGCGTGFFTPVLAQLSTSVSATDISEKMLDLTREKIKGLFPIEVLHANCEKTSFPSASFDTAFLGLVFQFANGPVTIAEMHRILKPGGNLILAVPTTEGLTLPDKLRGVMRQYRTFGRLRAPGTILYTRQSLTPVIVQGGFKILDIEHLVDPTHAGGFSGLYVRAEKI
ncbi:class I SAM-dependent methyltransferase [Methanoregula sp.]|uniref:class I SAM-dependent methyltransferase n=1 Tax=Methanoregula sp. TaxID=2052170 RepID=UPI002369F093|nr:class I SAM-dependent methyltransferase [Methanoregula sp.]MDD1686044.1 methyltransferase domain-containing protein [Methanoregula sp.]